MNIKTSLLQVTLVVVLMALMCCQGCTFTFKGKDIDLEGRTAKAYDLVYVGFTDATSRQ